jgi:hypothetical protein
MARIFDLRDILELVVNRLNNRALTRQELVMEAHQFIFHISTSFGKKLNAQLFLELGCQLLRNIALIAKDFAKQTLQ